MDDLKHWPETADHITMPTNPHPDTARTVDVVTAAITFGREQALHFPSLLPATITALILLWECERPHTKD